VSPESLLSDRATERERRVLQLIGLARKAGRAAVGTQAVKEAAGRGELALVVVAVDATENARRRLSGLFREADLPVLHFGSRDALGRAVGRDEAVVVGIRDRGLGVRIEERASAAGDTAPDARCIEDDESRDQGTREGSSRRAGVGDIPRL
jgi:ribosomal protein L7Ae-like RNA K-turn-binding protein